MTDHAIELAGTLQTAHINQSPSPAHDLNPSTTASKKEPVRIDSDAEAQSANDEIPIEAVTPEPRKTSLPPLPDLRFEQSYLASIKDAHTWGAVVWITTRDQVEHESEDCHEGT